MFQKPPKNYRGGYYLFSTRGCSGYEDYQPEDLDYEICKYCGDISYYH